MQCISLMTPNKGFLWSAKIENTVGFKFNWIKSMRKISDQFSKSFPSATFKVSIPVVGCFAMMLYMPYLKFESPFICKRAIPTFCNVLFRVTQKMSYKFGRVTDHGRFHFGVKYFCQIIKTERSVPVRDGWERNTPCRRPQYLPPGARAQRRGKQNQITPLMTSSTLDKITQHMHSSRGLLTLLCSCHAEITAVDVLEK